VGDCTHCGKAAGWFRSRHNECERKYHAGIERMGPLGREAIRKSGDLAVLAKRAQALAAASFIKDNEIEGVLIKAWEDVVQAALEDGVLTLEEEESLVRAQRHFGWEQHQLNVNGAYTRLVESGAIRDVLDGKLPARFQAEGPLPFNLQKGEQLIWAFTDVKYYEVRTRRSYVGGYQGVSVRIARGVYYRLGGFRGDPVVSPETIHVDTGVLGLTAKHLYFAGPVRSFRVRYDKIVSFTPYSDGIGFQRDAATAKPQALLTGDGWFPYNLVTNLANIHAGRAPAGTGAGAEDAADTDDDDSFELPVVGESHYQKAIESACGGPDTDGVDKIVEASLILEDSNPHDPRAVRVDIYNRTVGYLSRADARRFRASLKPALSRTETITCKARIRGGWDRGEGDRGNYGVWLNLSI